MHTSSLQIRCRSFKKLAFVFVGLLCAFGLLLNVTSDHSTLKSSSEVISLNPTLYANKYCVVYDFWKTTNEFRNNSITLVLHSTLKLLTYLEEHANSWNGPISLSIFMPAPQSNTNKHILSPHRYLNTLFSMLNELKQRIRGRNKISIHLFYETDKSNNCKASQFEFHKVSWDKKSIQSLSNFFSVYPINVARNIARKRLKTRLFLSSDIEQLFSANYDQKVSPLAYDRIIVRKQKIVLVHRRFESEENVSVPKTKVQLKKLYDAGTAVEFHRRFYFNGHYVPGLLDWFAVKENEKSVSVFGILNYTNPEYEPQFVGDSEHIPLHDENFPFRLRSNTHLAAELCRAGFKFAILNDVFSIHKGIKVKETGIEMAAKKLAFNNGYLKTVRQFMTRLDQQYPSTKDQCPTFLP